MSSEHSSSAAGATDVVLETQTPVDITSQGTGGDSKIASISKAD